MNNLKDKLVKVRMIASGKNCIVVVDKVVQRILIGKQAHWEIRCQKLLKVNEQIGPFACGSGRRIGCVGNVASNDGDVSLGKMIGGGHKFHCAAVAFADSDFHTIMKVKSSGWNIGDTPFLSGEQKNREKGRQVVIAVFNDCFFVLCHESIPL